MAQIYSSLIPIRLAIPNLNPNQSFITDHLIIRDNDGASAGYAYYKKNEELIDCQIQGISHYSKEVLEYIDYQSIISKRRENYIFLHLALQSTNKLTDKINIDEIGAPLSYPYFSKGNILHEDLWKVNIYAPVFWPDVSDNVLSEYEEKIGEIYLTFTGGSSL